MATKTLDNVHIEMLRWAYLRAGLKEEEAIKIFPQLEAWLSGEKLPTFSQLQKYAARFYVPFGYLFLQQAPKENIPFPMFRGDAALTNHFDLNVYDTVMNLRSRQEWLEDYLQENGVEICPIVEVVNLKTSIGETVSLLRKTLRLEPRWALGLTKVDTAVSKLTEQIEEAGIFIAYNGVVGNNTHRPLKVSECRGFALANKIAPYIFVNSSDSKSAQMFTLIHEVAHLMLGVSAGHMGDDVATDNEIERYCNKVAAEFLVPETELRQLWNGDIKNVSRRFKVSEIVAARRAHDLGILSNGDYNRFWSEYSKRPVEKIKSGSGGSFYLTSVRRVGRLFAIHVRNAVNSRQLSYMEAYRLTGLYGNTYQHFMTNNI